MLVRHSRAALANLAEPTTSPVEKLVSDLSAASTGQRGLPFAQVVQHHGKSNEAYVVSVVRVDEPVVEVLRDALENAMRLASDPVGAAVLSRGLQAIARLGAILSPAESASVLASATDQDLLLDLVKHAPSTRVQTTDDPLATARLRGAQMRETLLVAEGGTVTADQAGKLLGISRQAVDRRRKQNQLIALPIGGKSYAYPCWQFSEANVLRGFPEVLRAFSIEGTWARAAFFVSPNTSLDGERPLDALRRGSVDAVVGAAAHYGEQGAE